MKRLVLLVLLFAGVANAQIQEKSLLGGWHPAYVTNMGCKYTIATGEITISKEMEDFTLQKGGDPEEFKTVLAENLGMMVENLTIEFKADQVLNLIEGAETTPTRYSITTDGKITSLNPGEYTFVVKNQYLELLMDEANPDVMIIGFEKTKP